jgi:hypothetical protein
MTARKRNQGDQCQRKEDDQENQTTRRDATRSALEVCNA